MNAAVYDYSKLKGRIVEKCGSQEEFAKRMGLSTHSVSTKLQGKSMFKQCEIQKAVSVLSLDERDIHKYFFRLNVQDLT